MSYKLIIPISFFIFTFGTFFAIKTSTRSETLPCPDFNQAVLSINQHAFKIALATTPAQHIRGLSGCGSMAQNNGLYFPLPQKQIASFWMKEMLFPIDIIWINNNEIIGIEHNIPPPDDPYDSSLPTYSPLQPIDAVLELPAGTAKKLNISINDKIIL